MSRINYDFYKVPVVEHRSLSRLRFNVGKTEIHKVQTGPKAHLDMYAQIDQSDELIISLHGAYHSKTPATYPMFWRIRSLSGKAGAFLAFTDPTRLTDPHDHILLSWFLGIPGWDPQLEMLAAIQQAIKTSGACRVIIVGGSGGGFAALRLASEIPGSLAFVQEPATSLPRHNRFVLDNYFENAWAGWDRQKLMEAFPDKFDMTYLYMKRMPENFVYYTQSITDTSHYDPHFVPFAKAHGISPTGGENRAGNRVMMLYEGQVKGHGKITSTEFDTFFSDAHKRWLAWRRKNNFQ